jgi:carbon monoxide dehydrogenase subunit G
MELKGVYEFGAPVERVWAVLMDTTAIAACVPGCRELRDLGEDRYQAELVVVVAAITGNFGATIAIEDKVPPRSYRLTMQGTGRTGFVKGAATVVLESVTNGTAVHVDADADVGGAIARVGQRLIEGVARTTMNRFFACLAARLPVGT